MSIIHQEMEAILNNHIGLEFLKKPNYLVWKILRNENTKFMENIIENKMKIQAYIVGLVY